MIRTLNKLCVFLNFLLLIAFSHVRPVCAQEVRIDRIEWSGVSEEFRDTVQTVVGIFPGDPLEQPRITRAVESLKDFYVSNGFVSTAISSVFERVPKASRATGMENVLRFDVEEREPLHLANIVYDYVGDTGELKRLAAPPTIEFEPLERLSEDRVRSFKRSLEQKLTALDFIDNKITKIDSQVKVEEGSTKVTLTFHVDLGSRVRLTFRGNEFFTRAELLSTINEQRDRGLGRDYEKTIPEVIRQVYKDYGFTQTLVEPYSFERQGFDPKRLLFSIQEGPRVKVDRFIFDGNESFTSDELEEILLASGSDRVRSGYFNLPQLEAAANGMIQEIRRRGFLAARLLGVKTEAGPTNASVKIKIFVYEGLRTLIEHLVILGNQTISSFEIEQQLGLHPGDALNLTALEKGLATIKQAYKDQGNLQVKIKSEEDKTLVEYSEKNLVADLKIEIEEGPVLKLGAIRIDGNRRTKIEVIERELQLSIGEPIREYKVTESAEHLRRLGIFSTVNVDILDEGLGENRRTLRVVVAEVGRGNIGGGVGFRNDLGLRIFSELTLSNLWGRNHSWILNVNANYRLQNYRFIESQALMTYTWPFVFLGETTFRPSINYERRQYIQFDAEIIGFSASFDRSLIEALRMFGTLTYTLEAIRQFNARLANDDQQIRIGSITPALRFDFRDNPYNPRRGFFIQSAYEYASTSLGSESLPNPVGYSRATFRADAHTDIIPRMVWSLSGRGGIAKNHELSADSESSLPLIKQFALGGINNLRGYILQELNVQDRVVRDYMTFVNYRAQADYFFSQNLSVGPFLDAGNLNVSSFSFGGLRYGAGLGLRYATPVGPVNFDWGFKLFPNSNEQANVFYFSLGVI